jgi:hypothetical protein
VFNLKLIADAKEDIESRGQMIDIGNNKTFYQINFSVSIFHNAIKSINSLLRKLGLESKGQSRPEGKRIKPL